ncbi:MAG: hypothetical protein AAF089_04035 [Bacteroidota bacterium]
MSRLSPLVLLLGGILATSAANTQPITLAIDLGTHDLGAHDLGAHDLGERNLTDAIVGVHGDTAPLSWEQSLPLTDMEAPVSGDSDRPLPFEALVGDWTGTLTYTDYSDDTRRATLTISANGRALRRGGVRLDLRYVEPDGSSGGMGTTTLRERRGRIEYDGTPWTQLEREVRVDGFRIVLEREGDDNRRPATIRHTITLDGEELSDRKEVRYDGTDTFFERNLYRLTRAD